LSKQEELYASYGKLCIQKKILDGQMARLEAQISKEMNSQSIDKSKEEKTK